MAEVLAVDDDDHIRELVRHYLTIAGFSVLEAADGNEALELLESKKVDLAIIDIMMPGVDGFELCRLLRISYDFPILMLSARGATLDKVRGLSLGSDDYLVKPFEPEELIARVKALLRRYQIAVSQRVSAGALTLDRSRHEIAADEERYTIPLKEFELLFKLASSPGRTFTREQLIEDIWGLEFDGTERTVDVHINRLRDRFPEAQFAFRIVTIRGLGYRLESGE